MSTTKKAAEKPAKAETVAKSETVEEVKANLEPNDDEPMVFDLIEDEAPAPAAKSAEQDEARKKADEALAAKILSGADPQASNTNGGAGGRATIDEMLHDYFPPTEIVRVRNPFNHDTGWAYSDPKDIKIEQPSEETRRVYGIGRGFQKVRILHAGEDIIIPGWEAYIGLTRMFKAWVQETGDARNMNNTLKFKGFMEEAFMGIYDPNQGRNNPTTISMEEQLENDLGLI